MNRWQEQAKQGKEDLNQLEYWIATVGWSNLPGSVRRVIVWGQVSIEEKIPKWEEWAKEEIQAE